MRNQKGITLIALVITIIVLLILAGVSIAMLTGENGILTRANATKIASVEGHVRDAVTLAVSNYRAQKYEVSNPPITAENLKSDIQSTMGSDYTVGASGQNITVTSASGKTTNLGNKTITVVLKSTGAIESLTTN